MHPEALTAEARVLVPGLAEFTQFHLVGGTGLALQIGHRVSVDFDLFSEKPLDPRLESQVVRKFKFLKPTTTFRAPYQLNFTINNVKVTFFHFDYPVIEPMIPFKKMNMVSVPEIAAMKAFAMGQRLSYKDYIDWYFMLKEGHIKLHDVMALAEKKFRLQFNDRLFLGQLVSIADVKDQKIDFLRDPVDRQTIESYLAEAVKERGFTGSVLGSTLKPL